MRFAWLLGLVALWGGASMPAGATPTSFETSLAQGIVDLMFNPWSKRDIGPLIAQTIALKPGVVNRLGFAYGGPSQFWLDQLAPVARALRAGLPGVKLGGGFPEGVATDYRQSLACEEGRPPHLFDATAITAKPAGDAKFAWMDLGREEAVVYYACIGKILIRLGFSHFHFEQGTSVVHRSASVAAALKGLRRVEGELEVYGRGYDMAVSFSGDPDLARDLPLDAVYLPSRFFHDSFAREDRNRIEVPGVPGGYSYALSRRIVADTAATLPRRVKAMFYVDNFDASQDDLRRMMELGAGARRIMILRSAQTAADGGAVFIPSLNHCEGCVPKAVVTDACEVLVENQSTEYDAAACGDMATIGAALEIQRRAVTRP